MVRNLPELLGGTTNEHLNEALQQARAYETCIIVCSRHQAEEKCWLTYISRTGKKIEHLIQVLVTTNQTMRHLGGKLPF